MIAAWCPTATAATLPGSVTSPATTVTGPSGGPGSALGSRTTAVTEWPRAADSPTAFRPARPPAPKTTIFPMRRTLGAGCPVPATVVAPTSADVGSAGARAARPRHVRRLLRPHVAPGASRRQVDGEDPRLPAGRP